MLCGCFYTKHKSHKRLKLRIFLLIFNNLKSIDWCSIDPLIDHTSHHDIPSTHCRSIDRSAPRRSSITPIHFDWQLLYRSISSLYTAPWLGAMDGGHKVNASFPDKLSKVTEYIVPYFQTGRMVQSIKHKLTTTMLFNRIYRWRYFYLLRYSLVAMNSLRVQQCCKEKRTHKRLLESNSELKAFFFIAIKVSEK